LIESEPPIPAVAIEAPEKVTPLPLDAVPVSVPVPPPTLSVALLSVIASVEPFWVADAIRLPPLVLMVAPVTLIEPALAEAVRLTFSVPLEAVMLLLTSTLRPAVSVRVPPPVVEIPALITMSRAALSVRVLPLAQVTALATVMSPFCAPPLPVFTVTLAVASAFCSEVTDRIELLPVGEKVLPLLEMLVSAPFEMVTSKGSSISVPVRPLTALTSTMPA